MRTLFCCFLLATGGFAATQPVSPQSPGHVLHPMSFRDVLEVRGVSQGRLSPDGKRFAYVVSSLNWQQGRRWREVFVREADGRTRPVGANTGSDDTDPLFSPDGRWLGFLSDRSGAPQVYLTPASGGEPRRISDIPGGVTSFGFSGDDRSVVVLAGREDHRQLYLYEMGPGKIATLAPQIRGVSRWAWGSSPNRVYFTAPAVSDPFDQLRIEQRFDVQIADAVHPPLRLWDVNLVTGAVQQVRLQADLSIRNFTVSRSGQFLGITAAPAGRYSDERDEEAYLYDVEAGKLEKLTSNHVSESVPDISPNEEWVAFSAPEEFEPFRRSRIYLRPVRGGAMRMLPRDWDGDARGFTWSRDSKEMYFDDGVGLNEELFAVSAPGGRLRQLTERVGELHATYFENSDRLVVSFQSPAEPADYYLTTVADVAHRDRWKRLTDVNPQAREFALGEYEPVRWKSTDGQTVEGILVKPLNYKEGERYPVVVQLHGGPAGAYINNFAANWGTYVHVFAAAGYAVFQPNYRGSTNYGEKFRMEIAGDYFRKGFDDIMTGMDALIRMGIADPDRLGMMGWSAGGHWSNWALTHTDRFKAISTGAGAANWVSMYAETDAQDTREFYFGGTPYDNWNEYLDQSPLKYIRNAKTPTLIHVGEDDARVPKPQSDELYTALKKLGVPTEMVVYPRMGHNITEPRLQMAKMMLEFNWFEKYLRGRTYWLAWRDLVDTVPSEAPREMVSRDNRAARMLADRPEDKPAGAAKHSRRRGRAPARAFREPEADGNTVRPGSSARGN